MKILAAGLATRFTDLGRVGHQHIGYTQSGALDTNSHSFANAILGVPKTQPTIEILLGGFKAIATESLVIAITGAHSNIQIDGKAQPLNQAFVLNKGQTLEIKQPSTGARNYIASLNPFSTKPFLNSVCAVAREKTGGINSDGKSLQPGDVISYDSDSYDSDSYGAENLKDIQVAKNSLIEINRFKASLLETPISDEYIIKVVLAYQHALFDHKMKARFFHQQFTVSQETSAMGMRLRGDSIGHVSVKLYSEGIANGAVQITPEGLPIIMLAERQTIGGYPKLGSIISNDLPLLGQCRPGSIIRFEETDLFTARQLYLLSKSRLDRFSRQQAKWGA
ncbi:MAG: biotin-dependent carboxylase-like uncharacterized protein [Glaciecola sp.]|jgi:biotin-dependent carboxylase-like uncharacterized protein